MFPVEQRLLGARGGDDDVGLADALGVRHAADLRFGQTGELCQACFQAAGCIGVEHIDALQPEVLHHLLRMGQALHAGAAQEQMARIGRRQMLGHQHRGRGGAQARDRIGIEGGQRRAGLG
jgi:hypothetical protein